MSHFSKIKTNLKDLEIIKSSLKDLGINYVLAPDTIKEGDKNQYTALIIKQSKNYDIGFIWNGDEYQLVTDIHFWQQAWPIDVFLNRLTQRYAYNSINKLCEIKGFQRIEEVKQKDGSVKVVLQKWN